MKRLFTFIFAAFLTLFSTSLYGQMISEKKVEKDAKKQAKTLAKEGWIIAPGHQSIELQQLRASKLQNAYEEDLITPKYVFGSAQSVGQNYDAAKFQATELAKINIATQISSEVAGLIETNIGNTQISSEEAASITKTIADYKSFVAGKLTNVVPVIEMYRTDSKTKTTEVSVGLFYSKEEAMKTGIRVIREQMMKESEELGKELDTLLGLQ